MGYHCPYNKRQNETESNNNNNSDDGNMIDQGYNTMSKGYVSIVGYSTYWLATRNI